MQTRIVASTLAAGRLAIGLTLTASPAAVARRWVGPEEGDRPGARTLASGLGVRDAVIGAGTLATLVRGKGARPWLIASAVADLGDLVFIVRERASLPRLSVAGTALVAGGAAGAGAWLVVQGDW